MLLSQGLEDGYASGARAAQKKSPSVEVIGTKRGSVVSEYRPNKRNEESDFE